MNQAKKFKPGRIALPAAALADVAIRAPSANENERLLICTGRQALV